MLLEGRNAIVYGGGGAIGGAMAAGFAREGARVHLVGRTAAALEATAARIREAGGRAEIATLDATDEAAVDAHADAVARDAGSVDVVANLIGVGDVQGTPLAQLALADFEQPVRIALRSTFLIARAAARHMIPQRRGVILTFGGGYPLRGNLDYSFGGFIVALSAVDSLRRQLATELGRHGIRVVTLRTGGVPETIPADWEPGAAIAASLVAETSLGRAATLEDIGNVAAFIASDRARTITATAVNITCGAAPD